VAHEIAFASTAALGLTRPEGGEDRARQTLEWMAWSPWATSSSRRNYQRDSGQSNATGSPPRCFTVGGPWATNLERSMRRGSVYGIRRAVLLFLTLPSGVHDRLRGFTSAKRPSFGRPLCLGFELSGGLQVKCLQ
jgi:hypothetical protein